jgi:hypothetical protein
LVGSTGRSRGKIEFDKSFYYLLSWSWDKNGNPRPQTNEEQSLESNSIPLTDENGNTQSLHQRDVSQSHKTRAVYKSIDGNETDHITYLTDKSNNLAALATTGQFNRSQSALAYFTSYVPGMMYSLPAMRLSEKILYRIQMKALAIFLQLNGYEETFPRAVVFGPKIYGGIEFKEIYSECTCRKVEALSCHVNAHSEIGIMGIVDLNWQQLHCGATQMFFEGGKDFNYVKDNWFMTIQEFINKVNMKIFIKGLWKPKLYRVHDIILMDVIRLLPMSKCDKTTTNNWRMYFQVTNLSNLTNHSGSRLQPWFYRRRDVASFVPNSKINWPIQKMPSMSTFRVWVNALHRIFQFADTGELTQHLGAWIANPLDIMKIASLVHIDHENLAAWDYNTNQWKIHLHTETKWGNHYFNRTEFTLTNKIDYHQ